MKPVFSIVLNTIVLLWFAVVYVGVDLNDDVLGLPESAVYVLSMAAILLGWVSSAWLARHPHWKRTGVSLETIYSALLAGVVAICAWSIVHWRTIPLIEWAGWGGLILLAIGLHVWMQRREKNTLWVYRPQWQAILLATLAMESGGPFRVFLAGSVCIVVLLACVRRWTRAIVLVSGIPIILMANAYFKASSYDWPGLNTAAAFSAAVDAAKLDSLVIDEGLKAVAVGDATDYPAASLMDSQIFQKYWRDLPPGLTVRAHPRWVPAVVPLWHTPITALSGIRYDMIELYYRGGPITQPDRIVWRMRGG